jgi:hypothetical protein
MTSTAATEEGASSGAAKTNEQAHKHYMQSLQEDSTELRKNIKELRTQLKKEKKKLPPKAKRQEEDNDDDPMVSLSTMEDFLIKRGGLLRWTLVDDSWHATHPSAAN